MGAGGVGRASEALGNKTSPGAESAGKTDSVVRGGCTTESAGRGWFVAGGGR